MAGGNDFSRTYISLSGLQKNYVSRKERSAHIEEEYECEREVSLLYLILMVGTVWLGLTLFNFVKTPYLSPRYQLYVSLDRFLL